MLSSVRNALKGIMAWFVVALLILAFMFFGVPELRSFTQRLPIRVGDHGISTQKILSEFNRAMVNQRAQTEGAFTREDAIAAGLPDQIVQSLATRSFIEQEAKKMGVAVPRSEVRNYLQSNERFKNPSTDKFDLQVLTNLLQTYNFTVADFEKEVRQELVRNQLLESLGGGGYAPSSYVDAQILRAVEKRDISFLSVTDEMAGVPEEPSPDKLLAYYEANPDEFTAPEYRAFTLISLKESDFREGLEAPEEDLRRIYEVQKEAIYDKPERRTIYQITYDTEGEAQAAIAALSQGDPFEKIAEERGLSLDAVTYSDIGRDDILDPAVSEAAFAADLEIGSVADPVQGLFGWTVVQLVSATPPETTTFEEARAELESQYLKADTERRVYDAVDAIEEARLTGGVLTDAVADSNAAVTEFGPVARDFFTPDEEYIADIPDVVIAEAFRLSEGEESEAVPYEDDDGFFYLILTEVREAALRPYEDVAEDVESRWRLAERKRRIGNAVQQIRDALATGASLEEAVTPFNATPQTITITAREGAPEFSQELLTAIFLADKGADVAGPASLGDSEAVVVINNIDFDRAAIAPPQEQLFRQYAGYQLDQELLDAYLQTLQADYNVRIDQAQVDGLFNGQQ